MNLQSTCLLIIVLLHIAGSNAAIVHQASEGTTEAVVGLSGVVCSPELGIECRGSRICVNGENFGRAIPCDGTDLCYCRQKRRALRRCSCTNRKCPDNEECARLVENPDKTECGGSGGISSTFSAYMPLTCPGDSPEPTDDGQFVDVPSPAMSEPAQTTDVDMIVTPTATVDILQPSKMPEATEQFEMETIEPDVETATATFEEESATPEIEVTTPTPSATATPTPQSTDDGVCIDIEHLEQFEQQDLVFSSHYRTKVLCDASGSCATGGHMVSFNGQHMMMKTYCEMVECTPAVKLVNSPRYRRGLRIKSRSEGLEFTALAARYASKSEEVALAFISRMGL